MTPRARTILAIEIVLLLAMLASLAWFVRDSRDFILVHQPPPPIWLKTD